MSKNRPELLDKLNSLVNHYGGNDSFVANMNEWPRTIRRLIFNSMKLMLHFGLVELLPENNDDEFIGME